MRISGKSPNSVYTSYDDIKSTMMSRGKIIPVFAVNTVALLSFYRVPVFGDLLLELSRTVLSE